MISSVEAGYLLRPGPSKAVLATWTKPAACWIDVVPEFFFLARSSVLQRKFINSVLWARGSSLSLFDSEYVWRKAQGHM
jgi:hypothetical protein